MALSFQSTLNVFASVFSPNIEIYLDGIISENEKTRDIFECRSVSNSVFWTTSIIQCYFYLSESNFETIRKFRSNLFSVYANAMILFLICYGVPTSFFKWHVILIITMLSEILNDKFLAIFMIRIKNSLWLVRVLHKNVNC